jgi:hypothetical protein
MPEPYWPKKKHTYTMADAAKVSSHARMRCRYCKTERFYLVEELRVVFGNVEVDDVAYQRDWRCTNCGKLNTIDLTLENPSAEDLQRIKVQRIDKIQYVRTISWKTE